MAILSCSECMWPSWSLRCLAWALPPARRLRCCCSQRSALLLRYSVFAWFGANFLTLPQDIVGGTLVFAGLRIEASRLLAGIVALLVTLGLHLLLTRTTLGSKMLALAEDATADELMGISPDTMRAIVGAIAAAATCSKTRLYRIFFQ